MGPGARGLAVPAKIQQGQPPRHLVGREIEGLAQVFCSTELNAAPLEPQEQVHLVGRDPRKPEPVGSGGPVHIEAPAQGGRMLHLHRRGQPQGRVLLELEGEQIPFNRALAVIRAGRLGRRGWNQASRHEQVAGQWIQPVALGHGGGAPPDELHRC